MTHLQLEEQLQGRLTTSFTSTSHYEQRMVKAGDYRQAEGGNYVIELIRLMPTVVLEGQEGGAYQNIVGSWFILRLC